MHYLKDTGFIIARKNYSEADKYITILTQHNGKIEVLAKGVRKLTSRRAGNLELLNKISFQAVSRGQASRYVLADVNLLEAHVSLKKTLDSLKTLFTICELILVLCPQHERQENVFTLLDKTLTGMGSLDCNFALQSFQVNLLSVLGYWDARHAFVDADDVNQFTQNVMERKIRSSEYFRS